jgi:hypothetical protein
MHGEHWSDSMETQHPSSAVVAISHYGEVGYYPLSITRAPIERYGEFNVKGNRRDGLHGGQRASATFQVVQCPEPTSASRPL